MHDATQHHMNEHEQSNKKVNDSWTKADTTSTNQKNAGYDTSDTTLQYETKQHSHLLTKENNTAEQQIKTNKQHKWKK